MSGVRIVGESAAYSSDGDWFAFTARPSDDSAGPDIYVWRVGDPRAARLTDDHASVFASWSGDQLIGSRPAVRRTESAEVSAQSFLIDPSTRHRVRARRHRLAPDRGPEEPLGDHLGRDRAARHRRPVDHAGHRRARRAPLLAECRRRTAMPGRGACVTDGAVAEFDARWDESGTWLAVWLADPSDPSLGRLSLHHLDRRTGKLERLPGAPKDVTALPGFSIGDGRLAWATPPGQGGEGSRVQIVAWSDKSVGAVESGPVEDVVVIH